MVEDRGAIRFDFRTGDLSKALRIEGERRATEARADG